MFDDEVPTETFVAVDQHPSFEGNDLPPTDKMRIRPVTNGDWPPSPPEPTARRERRAGMYKAITSITKLTKLKT